MDIPNHAQGFTQEFPKGYPHLSCGSSPHNPDPLLYPGFTLWNPLGRCGSQADRTKGKLVYSAIFAYSACCRSRRVGSIAIHFQFGFGNGYGRYLPNGGHLIEILSRLDRPRDEEQSERQAREANGKAYPQAIDDPLS
jgi:hypothetical protein